MRALLNANALAFSIYVTCVVHCTGKTKIILTEKSDAV